MKWVLFKRREGACFAIVTANFMSHLVNLITEHTQLVEIVGKVALILALLVFFLV